MPQNYGYQPPAGFPHPNRFPGFNQQEFNGMLGTMRQMTNQPTNMHTFAPAPPNAQGYRVSPQQMFEGVTPQQMNTVRNGVRGSLGMPPAPMRPAAPQRPGVPPMRPQPGVQQPAGGNMRPIGMPSLVNRYDQSPPAQSGMPNLVNRYDNQPKVSPQEAMQRTQMGGATTGIAAGMGPLPPHLQDYADQHNARFGETKQYDAPGSFGQSQFAQQQAQIAAGRVKTDAYRNNMRYPQVPVGPVGSNLPDATDPNFTGITDQEAFRQIPGNIYQGMENRLNKLGTDPIDNSLPDMGPISEFQPKYQTRDWRANPPAPRPKIDPVEAQRIADEKQAARFADQDRRFKNTQRQDAAADYRHNRMIQGKQKRFMMDHPELFAQGIGDLNAQLYNSLNGGWHPVQQNGIKPAEAMAAGLQARNQSIQEAQFWQDQNDPERANQAMERANQFGFPGQNTNTIMGGQAGQPGQPVNPRMIENRGNEFRTEDGSIDFNRFGQRFGAASAYGNMTKEGLLSQGITEDALTQYIQHLDGWFGASGVQQANVERAKNALAILRGQQPNQSNVRPLEPPQQSMLPPLPSAPPAPTGRAVPTSPFFPTAW